MRSRRWRRLTILQPGLCLVAASTVVVLWALPVFSVSAKTDVIRSAIVAPQNPSAAKSTSEVPTKSPRSKTASAPKSDGTAAMTGESRPETRREWRTHTVVRGDTLIALARYYRVRVEDLLTWNRLDAASILRIGQTLRVYAPAQSPPASQLEKQRPKPVDANPTLPEKNTAPEKKVSEVSGSQHEEKRSRPPAKAVDATPTRRKEQKNPVSEIPEETTAPVPGAAGAAAARAREAQAQRHAGVPPSAASTDARYASSTEGLNRWQLRRAQRKERRALRRETRLARQRARDKRKESRTASRSKAKPSVAPAPAVAVHNDEFVSRKDRRRSMSVGRPNRGGLVHGVQLGSSRYYTVRSPDEAWGSAHTIEQLHNALRRFRQHSRYRDELIVQAISKRDGGRFPPHRSHQSGRDVDIRLPRGKRVPPQGVPHRARDVDWDATWILVLELLKTGQVEYIFLDYSRQKYLFEAARRSGMSRAELQRWIQWPSRERNKTKAVVRHSPGHTTHLHVRFRCASHERRCETL